MGSKDDPGPRVLFFDIEATALNASFGHCLCCGFKYLNHGKAWVVSVNDVPEPKKYEEPDAPLMRRLHTILTDEADVIVSFYGKGYDRPFLNTRMLLAGLPPLPPLSSEHIDLFYTCRSNLRLHSNRLQAVSETLGCPINKTPVRADTWRKAQRGDPAALAYVIAHCRRDVLILEWVYNKMKPFVRQHPWVGLKGVSCRVCGSTKFQRRGFNVTTGAQPKQRIQCRTCGHWATLP